MQRMRRKPFGFTILLFSKDFLLSRQQRENLPYADFFCIPKDMTVSMVQFIIELPETTSIKDKRMVIHSLRDRIIRKFNVSCAEVDLQDSLSFAQIGAALVTNSRSHGESVMQKIILFVEDQVPGRLQDVNIYSESY
jgi:uncharacterized protein YlxP (DUF503 family)